MGPGLRQQNELGRLSTDSEACVCSQAQDSYTIHVGLSLPARLLPRALGNLCTGKGVSPHLSGSTGHGLSTSSNPGDSDTPGLYWKMWGIIDNKHKK